MTVSTLRVPPATRAVLTLDTASAVLVDVRHDGGERDLLLLPGDACAAFEVTTAETGITLSGAGLRLHPADRQGKTASNVRFAAPMRFGVSVRSIEDRGRNRRGRNAVHNLRMMDLGSEALLTLENSSGMFGKAVPPLAMPDGDSALPLRAGVAVHLFYHDLWPEFAQFIRASGLGGRVFVSMTSEEGGIRERIRADF
ncbi:MAG: hypothetical protein MUF63_07835, partial [Rhodobacteraceae bacterium]|nr:hypothetical protein [Paracoccaceae bacterium]